MEVLWKHYVDTFRKLIISGFLVFRKSTRPIYYYMYPETSLPVKWKIGEAAEIYNYASNFNDIAGTSKYLKIQYNVITDKEYYLWQGQDGRAGRGRD